MARFPKIQRKCPVRNSLAEYMDGDVCRLCSRQVFSLDAMTDDERMAFMASCKDEVCVSYKAPLRSMAAAAALAAATATVPAAAQEKLVDLESDRAEYEELPNCADELTEFIIVVGAIKDPNNVEYVDTAEDLETPALPVTYEDEEQA